MTVQELTTRLENNGVKLTFTGGRLKAAGDPATISAWRDHIIEHKPAILDHLVADLGNPTFCRQHVPKVFAQCPGPEADRECFCLQFLLWRKDLTTPAQPPNQRSESC